MAPQPVPREVGRPPVPAHEDLKVAGSPNHAPPGQDAGFYDAGVYETTDLPDHGEADASTPATPAARADGNATAAYDMGTAYGPGTPPPYEVGATTAMPSGGPDDGAPGVTAPDFEAMRRKPRASNKRMIRLAAVAAAVAVAGGGGVAWAVAGGSPAERTTANGPIQTQTQAPAPAPLTDAQRKDAEDKRRQELKKRASRAARNEAARPKLLARGTPPPTKKPKATASATAGGPVPSGDAQQIARAMLSNYGWSPSSQFGCLVNLWNKESRWNTHAANPSSGAYGIPQALPGSKMSSAGPDWQNNASTQIKWGLGYIKDRYSTPCGAWAHSQSTGWY